MPYKHCTNCGTPMMQAFPFCPQCGTNLSTNELEKPVSTADAAAKAYAESEVPSDLKEGDVLLDLYEVKGVLGEGGMGKVYKIHHRGWDLDVAMKSPKPQIFSKPGGRNNFVREAQTWVRIGLHPHIVSCYLVQVLGGIPRVFAEYADGGSLLDWIRTRKFYEGDQRQAVLRILDVAIQFAWGLHYAHEQGIVHQDIKPANVMMLPDGTAKVADFGLAKARFEAGDIFERIGGDKKDILVSTAGMTRAYCSPEQADHQLLSRKTDIWSWGLSVLEMFTGKVTWYLGPLAMNGLESYWESGAKDGSTAAMPSSVAEVLRGCFSHHPNDRPNDMDEIAGILVDIYAGLSGDSYQRTKPESLNLRADSLNNRAVSLFSLGFREEAERSWNEALSVETSHPDSMFNYGLACWRSGRLTYDEFNKKIQDVRKANSEGWKPDYILALFLAESGNYQKAIESLEKIVPAQASQSILNSVGAVSRAHLPYSAKLLYTLTGHTGAVHSARFHPKGNYLLSGASDYAVKLWEVKTSSCLLTFEGHQSAVKAVCFTPDGRYAVSGGDTIRVWGLASGVCVKILDLRGASQHYDGSLGTVRTLDISPDGRYLVSGHDYQVLKIWDTRSWECLKSYSEGLVGEINYAGFIPGTHTILIGSYDPGMIHPDMLSVRDLATGEVKQRLKGSPMVLVARVSRDGRYAVSVQEDYQKTVVLWDLSTGKRIRIFGEHPYVINALAWTPYGDYVIAGCQGRISLWETETGRCLHNFPGDPVKTISMDVSENGRCLLSAGADGTIKIWEIGFIEKKFAAPMIISRASSGSKAVSAQSEYRMHISAASKALEDGQIQLAAQRLRSARSVPGHEEAALSLWTQLYPHIPRERFRSAVQKTRVEGDSALGLSKASSNQLPMAEDYWGNAFAISRHTNCAFAGREDGSLALLDLDIGICRWRKPAHAGAVRAVAVSEGIENYGLSGGDDGVLALWNLDQHRCLQRFQGPAPVTLVAISGDGKYGLSNRGSGSAQFYDLTTGQANGIMNSGATLQSLSLSGDASFAAAGTEDGRIQIWLTASRKCSAEFQAHQGPVRALAINRGGNHLLSVSEDGTLKYWNLASGACFWSAQAQRFGVTSIDMDYEERCAVTGGEDNTTKLWDLTSGECLLTLEAHKYTVVAVRITPYGEYVISCSLDGRIMGWILDWDLRF